MKQYWLVLDPGTFYGSKEVRLVLIVLYSIE